MAKINFTLGDIKGKMGGVVFQGGPAGPIIRAKGSPIDAPSPIQTLRRERFGGVSRLWAYGLTQAQRDGWNTLALGVSLEDGFGNPVEMSGQMLFQRISSNRELVGDNVLLDAPADLNVRALVSAETDVMEEDDTQITLEIADICGANERVVIFGAINLSPAVTNAYSLFSLLHVSDLAAGQGYVFTFPSKWGKLLPLRKNIFRCQRYNQLNGMLSSGIVCEGIIEDLP